ncbi:hypothetical protein XaFJ1_GM002345 [Xanthomonas albilineans]|nr:hypothetical protein XaFJ1_GM002345 [Xanthomonas albilineans]
MRIHDFLGYDVNYSAYNKACYNGLTNTPIPETAAIRISVFVGVVAGVPIAVEVAAGFDLSSNWINTQESPDTLVIIALLHISQPSRRIHDMPRVTRTIRHRAIEQTAIRLILATLNNVAILVCHHYDRPQPIRVDVADRLRRGGEHDEQ